MISETVAVALISGACSLVIGAFGVLKVWIPVVAKKKAKKMERGLESLSRGYDLMRKLTSQNIGANRVILFSAHNSGGIPRFGKPFYVTKVHCEVSPGVPFPPNYTNLKVDSHYVRMLETVMKDDYYEFITANEPPSQLKDYYELEGVVESRVYFLGIQDREFVYMSVSTLTQNDIHVPMTSKQKTLTKLIVNDIRTSLIRDSN